MSNEEEVRLLKLFFPERFTQPGSDYEAIKLVNYLHFLYFMYFIMYSDVQRKAKPSMDGYRNGCHMSSNSMKYLPTYMYTCVGL